MDGHAQDVPPIPPYAVAGGSRRPEATTEIDGGDIDIAVAKNRKVPRDPGNGRVPDDAFERIRRSILVLSSLSLLIPSLGQALTFQVDFRNSTYQVQGSDTFASLLAQHASETLLTSNSVNALQGISAPVYAGGVNSDYSILMAADLNVLISGPTLSRLERIGAAAVHQS